MAYIRKRGKTWSYTVDVGRDLVTRERKQETKGGFRTKKEAEQAAARIETEIADGKYAKETKQTFKEFAEQWLIFYESTGEFKPGSVLVRKTRINKLNSYFAVTPLPSISRTDYQNMLIDLKKTGLANETIISIHATAKLIFRRAVELKMLKSDPTQYSRVPRQQLTVEQIENRTDLPKYMEKEELARFLKAAKEHGKDKDHNLFMFLSYTGLRIGEATALKWKDIDLDNHTISITKTYYNGTNNTPNYKLVPPKTLSSIRTIEFDEVIETVLENQKALLNVYRMKYRKTYHDEDFVFPNLGPKYPGYPDVQKNPEARMKKILETAGMNTDLTPHSLRHTHTSLLAEAGASLQETMERLGHKDDKTTIEVYLHVTKTMKRGAAQKFSNLMSNVVKL